MNQQVHTDFRVLTGRFCYQRIRKGRHGQERWLRAQLRHLGLHSLLRILEAGFLSDDMGTKISSEPLSVVWCRRCERVRGPGRYQWARPRPPPPAQTDSMDGPVTHPPVAGTAPFWKVSGFLKTYNFFLSCLLD